MREPQPKPIAVGAWVVYEVANTIFWAGVVGLSFPLWITKHMSGNDATLGYTLAAAMVAVLVIAPVLGAISDQSRRRMPLLLFTTLACIAATLLLGNGGLLISLGLFAIALCSMELGTVFYNSLLTEVSMQTNRGTIAGLGIGIGYAGAFIAVGVALLFTQLFTEPRSYLLTFRVDAVLFLLFALPIFFFLRERRSEVLSSTLLSKTAQAFRQLGNDLRSLHRFLGLRQFFMARFLYIMGVSTATTFAVVYASQTIGLSDRDILLILLAGVAVAIPSGALWGIVVDRIGAKPVLTLSLLMWIGLLLVAVGIPWLSWNRDLWWAVGCLTGMAMAGVFTADRPFLLNFTPHRNLGEFFGLHGMVGKSGRVLGPFMWAFISSTLGLGQPAALLGLVGCLVVSYVILGTIRTPVVPSPSTDLAE